MAFIKYSRARDNKTVDSGVRQVTGSQGYSVLTREKPLKQFSK